MKTFQDLEALKKNEANRGQFCRDAVDEFKATKDYKDAEAGEAYYAKHNLTIEKYQKMIRTVSGREVPDIFSADYRIKTLFFRRFVTQQVQYVLGNGVTLQEEGNKDRLGKNFDFQLQTVAKRAMASGKGFGFWNFDHLEVFGYAETSKIAGFCPLYDDSTAQLRAGIRFWTRTVGDSTIRRFTLYEEDGITEYIQKNTEKVAVLGAKKAYKTITTKSQMGGVEETKAENYTKLPIVPLYSNDTQESELIGIRESIDCYDFIKSGLANAIDDSAGFYWILKNTGGMDDPSLAQFIQRLKTVKATALDGDEGVDAEAHTLDVPVTARQTMLELLRKDMYEDFQALDVNTLSASAKTTQEIQASYQAQDNKCADFEYYILDFVQNILELAEIDDNPTLIWNRVVNQNEQTQMVLSAQNILPEDVVIRHLPFLTPEEADDILEQKELEDMEQFDSDEQDNSDMEEINSLLDEVLASLGDEEEELNE